MIQKPMRRTRRTVVICPVLCELGLDLDCTLPENPASGGVCHRWSEQEKRVQLWHAIRPRIAKVRVIAIFGPPITRLFRTISTFRSAKRRAKPRMLSGGTIRCANGSGASSGKRCLSQNRSSCTELLFRLHRYNLEIAILRGWATTVLDNPYDCCYNWYVNSIQQE